MMYPFGKKSKKGRGQYMDRYVVIGLGLFALFLTRRQIKESGQSGVISDLKFYYYNPTAVEFVETNVRNGATYNGDAMGVQIRFTDSSENGSAVRITHNSKRDGTSVTAGTWSKVLSPSESGTYYLEPRDYGGTSMGVDTVDFVVEVLPPQTGGVPQEGESYPTYRFAYRL